MEGEGDILVSDGKCYNEAFFFKKRDEERGRRGREGKVISYCIP